MVSLMKVKTDAFIYFFNLKIPRIDNGEEFCSHEFEMYLKDQRIIHQRTFPFIQEKNSLRERMKTYQGLRRLDIRIMTQI